MTNTIHEIIVTTAKDLNTETVGFGSDGAMAKRVYDWTTNALMRDGFILLGKVANLNFVEVIQRGGTTVMFIELRSRPATTKAALSNDREEIEAFYRSRYCGRGWMDFEPDFIGETEDHIRTEWYRLGLYDKRGYDYDRRSYRLVDSEADDLEVEEAMEARAAQREWERREKR
jgi:hypothetical protein